MGKGDVTTEELQEMSGKDQAMSKEELAAMKKQWMEEMKANMKKNEKVNIVPTRS